MLRRVAFRSMGCGIAIVVDETRRLLAPLAELPALFTGFERALSRFHDDSELARLNRQPGTPVPVGPILWQAICAALEAARWSDGLVHPALLPALERAGYDRDFAQLAASSREEAPLPCAPTPDWRSIVIDDRHRTIRLPVGVRLDLGGTAKGWIADLLATRLAEHGAALVDAGGDVAMQGERDEPWPIAIASPHRPGASLGTVGLRAGGIATSGRDHRRWSRGGEARHHIIDPRTGEPARTDVLSATVVAKSAFRAEVAAKVVLLQGSGRGLAWLETNSELAGLVVLESGEVHESRGFAALRMAAPAHGAV